MILPAETMYGLLDGAVATARSTSRSVYDALGDLQQTALKNIQRGVVRTQQSSGDVSSSGVLVPGANPSQMAQAYGELRWIWRQREAVLVAAGATAPVNEATVLAEVQKFLDADWTESFGDFSEVQLPNTYAKIQ